MSFKDTLDGLSAYLLWKKPPKSAVLIEGALKGVCRYNGCEDTNRLNNSILDAIVLSVETTAGLREKKRWGAKLYGLIFPTYSDFFALFFPEVSREGVGGGSRGSGRRNHPGKR
jgi:hypothetical protein